MTDSPMSEAPLEHTPTVLDPVEGIGERLTVLREQKRRRISTLAREIGVSPSLVSQIERGQSRPSVSTLFALAEALGVPVDAFFRDGIDDVSAIDERHDALAPLARFDSAPRAPVPTAVAASPPVSARGHMVRRDDRAAIEIERGVRWERLTPTALPNIDFLELVYAPHAQSNPDLYRHPGTEMLIVTDGRLDVYVGFDRYALGPGDSIHFPSAFPHRYVNPTDAETRAITVILTDGAAHDTAAARRL